MEENCLSSSAYEIRNNSKSWRNNMRRLLRFSTIVHNRGDADFRPYIAKGQWEWHACHMHYHSMEVFAHYDIMDDNGTRLAEGSKASFCLEDTTCDRGVSRQFQCVGFGDQVYQLQQEAPQPFCVACLREVPSKPEFYGNEEKRFDTVYDLADGLIHFYIELRAADYIKQLSSESTYEESPYMAYNQCRLRHDETLRVRPTGTYKCQSLSPHVTDAGSDRGDIVVRVGWFGFFFR
ncbi:hypothetical protein ACOMHN_066511 [Nucella lapillus]